MENVSAIEKIVSTNEIVITEENNLTNVSRILNISELDDKYYAQTILSPSNSISICGDIIRKDYFANNFNSNFDNFLLQDKLTPIKKDNKATPPKQKNLIRKHILITYFNIYF